MGRPSRLLESLRTAVEHRVSRQFASDIFEPAEPLTPEVELEQRRSEPRNGLTDLQRLFLFGKLGDLNDKDAAIAAGYSESVAENSKQRIWKPRVRAEFERMRCVGASTGKKSGGSSEQEESRNNDKTQKHKG